MICDIAADVRRPDIAAGLGRENRASEADADFD
jgi:hypothetical protein